MNAALATDRDLAAVFARYRPMVDEEMGRVVAESVENPWMQGVIGYHLGWTDASFRPLTAADRRPSGKKMRAALVLLAYEGAAYDGAAGPRPDARVALPLAAAIELFHNFTLIHDDIQDGAPSRWGRPTLWTLCGMGEAINVGDCLHALAIGCLGRLRDDGVADAIVVELTADLVRAAVALAVGQHQDLAFESQLDVTPGRYLEMIAGKTAALLRSATYGGALLADRERAIAYATYGKALGQAFQIRDDILGIWGSEAGTGKAGRDIRRKKKTLPILFALEHGDHEVSSHLRRLYSRPGELTADEEADVRAALDATNACAFAQEQAELYRAEAVAALAAASRDDNDANPFHARLRGLAHFAATRTF